jgi:hypothetical protein
MIEPLTLQKQSLNTIHKDEDKMFVVLVTVLKFFMILLVIGIYMYTAFQMFNGEEIKKDVVIFPIVIWCIIRLINSTTPFKIF